MRILTAAAAALALNAALPAAATPASGELRCMIAGGVGYVIAGKRAASCIYYRRDGRVEFYIGSLGRFGIDLGPTQARNALFAVITREPPSVGALEGNYLGLGTSVSIGRGLSGDALVGGRDQTVQIVPITNSRIGGLNVAVGIGELHLRYAGTEGRRERYRNDLPEGLD